MKLQIVGQYVWKVLQQIFSHFVNQCTIKDKKCEFPPLIPNHEDFKLVEDEGNIHVKYYSWPDDTNLKEKTFYNSTVNNISEVIRSFNSTLFYSCGKGREFKLDEDFYLQNISLNCQWNRTWVWSYEPQVLPECDWVACYAPPHPPPG